MSELTTLLADDEINTNDEIINKLPELITSASHDFQSKVFDLCNSVDDAQHKVRFAAVEMGKALLTIREMINNECRQAKNSAKSEGSKAIGITATPIFENFLQVRFGKSLSWANRLIMIYRHFTQDDPLLEVCTTHQLVAISYLEAEKIDTQELRTRLLNGERFTVEEINNIEKAISGKSADLSVVQETTDKLMQLQNQVERSTKEIERRDREQQQLQNEVKTKAEQNETLIKQLRDKQEAERNISLENQQVIDNLKKQIKAMEEDIQRAKSKVDSVEIPVVPEGFKTIEEAIQFKEEELEKISQELSAAKQIFHSRETASKLFGELLKNCDALSIQVHDVINKTSQSDIEANMPVINKIMFVLNSTHNNLSQIA